MTVASSQDLGLPDDYLERLPRSWRPWVEHLPEMLEAYLERWQLTVTGAFDLSFSYVVPVARADGRACVLKLQPTDVPGVEGADMELLGLRLAGPVTVGVIEEDAASGALLLERAQPGTTLEAMCERDDEAATVILATVIRAYGRPLEDPGSMGLRPFGEFAEAFERFDRGPHGQVARKRAAAAPESRLSVLLGMDELGTGIPAMRSARDTAERVLGELTSDHREPYLLHGDLHHGNVLADDERGHLVVDPWGLYGDRSADVAPALENPLEFVARTPDLGALLRRRLAVYTDVLHLDGEQLAAWCYVYSTIRALWSLEDGGDASSQARTVGALRTLI